MARSTSVGSDAAGSAPGHSTPRSESGSVPRPSSSSASGVGCTPAGRSRSSTDVIGSSSQSYRRNAVPSGRFPEPGRAARCTAGETRHCSGAALDPDRDGTDGAPADGALLERARIGDLAAYELLVRRYAPVAHRTAVLLGGGSEADDVVQEAFVKAYRGLGGFRHGAAFRPWLLAIVAHEAANVRRSAGRRAGLVTRATRLDPAVSAPDPRPSPESAALASAASRALLAAVRRCRSGSGTW